MNSEKFFSSFHRQALMLNDMLPEPFFARVEFVNPSEGKVLTMIFKRRFWFPKKVAIVRGNSVVLTDSKFYDQLKPIVLEAGMKIV